MSNPKVSGLYLLRRFSSKSGVKSINGKRVDSCSIVTIYQELVTNGIEVPSEIVKLITPTLNKKLHKPSTNNVSIRKRVPANNPVVEEIDHPAFDAVLDLKAVRERVCREVQQSNRPADFKRAIELLTELGQICEDAWYRRQESPWGHDDWAHVSSEVEAIHSIVGQRAEETADELLRQSTVVEVRSTVVS